MINPNSTNQGGLNYVFSKNFLNFYLSSNIIAIAVTVYLVYLFICFVYILYHFLFILSISNFLNGIVSQLICADGITHFLQSR